MSLLTIRQAHAQEDTLGSLGALTVGLGLGLGFQPDSRTCETAGSGRPLTPGGSGCALFAGGVDASFLWRGRVGASLGLWSVAGQAAVPQGVPPSGQAPAAYPDRISIPLLLDVRPLAFFRWGDDGSYLRRLTHGVRLAIGPSFELVRTSSDSSLDFADRTGSIAKSLLGMHLSLDGEIPLHASLPSALSLRVSLRALYVPVVALNDGMVQSAIVGADQTPAMLSSTLQGYATHFQFLMGLAYYL